MSLGSQPGQALAAVQVPGRARMAAGGCPGEERGRLSGTQTLKFHPSFCTLVLLWFWLHFILFKYMQFGTLGSQLGLYFN